MLILFDIFGGKEGHHKKANQLQKFCFVFFFTGKLDHACVHDKM